VPEPGIDAEGARSNSDERRLGGFQVLRGWGFWARLWTYIAQETLLRWGSPTGRFDVDWRWL